MSVKVREKRGKLYLDIYTAGRRKWEALHLSLTGDKARDKEIRHFAEVCRSKRETQLLTAAWDIPDPVAGNRRLVAWLEKCAATHASPGPTHSLIHHLKNFRGGEGILLSQVSSAWLTDFQDYLTKKDGAALGKATASVYLSRLRGALKKALMQKMLPADPSIGIRSLSAPDPEIVFLTAAEVQRMADVKSSHPRRAEVRRAFLFACHTGLRVSDIETLTWGKIEPGPPAQIIKRQEKTEAMVYIPLDTTALALLGETAGRDPDDKVFSLTPDDRPLAARFFLQWAKDAQVTKRVTWHVARRTFATLALEAGVDAVTVARLLGHRKLDQVMRYAQATEKLRRMAVAALPETKI